MKKQLIEDGKKKISAIIIAFISLILGLFIKNIEINDEGISFFQKSVGLSISKTNFENIMKTIGFVLIGFFIVLIGNQLLKVYQKHTEKRSQRINTFRPNHSSFSYTSESSNIEKVGKYYITYDKTRDRGYLVLDILCVKEQCRAPLLEEPTYFNKYMLKCLNCNYSFKSDYNKLNLMKRAESLLDNQERLGKIEKSNNTLY